MREVDPIKLEVIRHALVAAAEEMSLTIWRTARSTVVREILDYSTAVFDAGGGNVAQSARIPVHLNSMADCLRTVLTEHLPPATWRPGDVVIVNDPYHGGQHLPDIQTFMPVFEGERLIAICGTLCHHADVGGGAAGSYYADATEIFQEGLRIPPLKLVAGGVRNEAVMALLRTNVREPGKFDGDLAAQLAALGRGAAAVAKLATKYGGDTLTAAMARIQDGSERLLRRAIAALPPDVVGQAHDLVDDDGIDAGPIEVRVTVRVEGDQLVVDFSGSGPAARGPVNNTPAMTASAVSFAVLSALGPDIPANSGCDRPITLVLPEGSVVNARFPAPVAGRMVVNHRLAGVVLEALAAFVPDRVGAAYYGISYVYAVQLADRRGEPGVYFDIEVGGWGGHPEGDGASALSCGMHNNANAPIEMVEALYPVHFERYGLLADTGGAGRHRGGLGLERSWRFEGDEARLSTNFERFRYPPRGLAGGGDGSLSRTTVIDASGHATHLPSKISGHRLQHGDTVHLETSGGGGFGAPETRDPDALAADLAAGYVVDPSRYRG